MASQDWIDKDFYSVLGVAKDASAEEIKKAYRKLARQHHPDKNPGDVSAEQRFKDISEAHSVLSDPEQRQQYDAIRAMGSGARFSGSPGGEGGGFEDLFGGLFGDRGEPGAGRFPGGFEDIFGGMGSRFGSRRGAPAKGADRTAKTTISFKGAVRGTTVGLREPSGNVIDVRIPAGIREGQKVRVKGKGQQGPGGSGDLLVEVSVQDHPFFERDGDNIRIHLPVSFDEAALGTTVEVPTVHGEKVRIRVPAGSSTGKTLRLKGQGIHRKNTRGDMLVVLEVVVPEQLNEAAEAAVRAFAEATRGSDPREGLLAKAAL
ncbi:DnaJ C-terminal domain-containing protein [Nesterenkonia alkaliphila]|uniref:DnaJ C-terminal domain-containing protein n=1 Tax=Nesterenkonia alkaliphila TaxID=1463631 RepID=UPI0012F70A8D|nr:DnaJ C-terminal domain-containing protein [Nesterenkonia alkaliphila]GFZ90535.1 molecular chaperone DnaJ [Nesterenkonia alkaliphila]